MTAFRWGVIGLLLWLVLAMFSAHVARLSIVADLREQLERLLPARIAGAGINAGNNEAIHGFLVQRIDADLADVQVSAALPVVSSARVRVESFESVRYATPTLSRDEIVLNWPDGERPQELKLLVSYRYNWPLLLGFPLLLATALVMGLRGMPPPLAGARLDFYHQLTARGYSPREARRRLSALTPWRADFPALFEALALSGKWQVAEILPVLETLARRGPTEAHAGLEQSLSPDWLALGLTRWPGDTERALAVAEAEPVMILHADSHRVSCHGVEIPLPPTPFFYLLWYARRRVDGPDDGWFTNPPSNRPDTRVAAEVLALLEAHDGNGRAVKELRENGLRSKILDQNRSKIKDEIVAVLGVSLAQDYLFEQQRDTTRGRNMYRLALPPQYIKFAPATHH